MYEHQDFPKWIYSSEGSRLIQSKEEHPGVGWFESPADVGKEETQPEPEKRKPGRPKKSEAE